MSNPESGATVVKSVIKALAEERVRQGVSKNRLAQMTGLSLTTISYFERNMRNPTFETVARISIALGVDLGGLVQRAFSKIGNT